MNMNIRSLFKRAGQGVCVVAGAASLLYLGQALLDLSPVRSVAGLCLSFASFVPLTAPSGKMRESLAFSVGISAIAVSLLALGFSIEEKLQAPAFKKAQLEMLEQVKDYSLKREESTCVEESFYGLFSGKKKIGAASYIVDSYTNEKGQKIMVLQLGPVTSGKVAYTPAKTYKSVRRLGGKDFWVLSPTLASNTKG